MRLAVLLVTLAVAARASAEQRQYAVVVGNNLSVDEGVQPLRYADDDAARYAELLGPLSARLSLLAVLDQETQAIHPDLARRSVPPTRAALAEAIAAAARDVVADKAAGRETTLLFVFVGHGNVGPNREGYVSLLDGKLTRGDLFESVIKAVPADYVHLIIDACNAYTLVNRRGGEERGPQYGELVQTWLDDHDLSRHPHVGAVLSTAGERESHEWSGFRAGVFSHEVRSALGGAADVNRDGRVEYSELKAFVAAANLGIEDARARPEVWAQPPARDRSRALVDLRAPGFQRFLLFPARFSGRFWIEDGRGVRLADFHKAGDRTVAVALPEQPVYWLRSEGREARIPTDARGITDASALAWNPTALAARGSIDQAFQRSLFSVPYGDAFYRGFTSTSGDLPVAPSAGGGR